MIEIEHLNKTYPSPGGDIHALRGNFIAAGRRTAFLSLIGQNRLMLVSLINTQNNSLVSWKL